MENILKLGYFDGGSPPNCELNNTSYLAIINSCSSEFKARIDFVYAKYLFPKITKMVPLKEIGNFSETGQMTSNGSVYQALQFGTIDGFVGTAFFITAERFEHFAFATPFKEEQFCLVMSTAAVKVHAEAAENLYWLKPFSVAVWAMFFASLLLFTFLPHKRKGKGFSWDIVGSLIMTTFVAFYCSVLKASFVKDFYVSFPYQSLGSLNEPIRTGVIQLAATRYPFVHNWLADSELKTALQQNPLLELFSNIDICDYRNYFIFKHSKMKKSQNCEVTGVFLSNIKDLF